MPFSSKLINNPTFKLDIIRSMPEKGYHLRIFPRKEILVLTSVANILSIYYLH